MKALIAKVRLFVFHAKSKLTTLLALLIAGAGEARNSWPDVVANSPQWPWLLAIENHIFMILGALVIYARVRRLLKEV